jgi:hypothetical protein
VFSDHCSWRITGNQAGMRMPNDHVVTTYTPVVVNGVVTFNQSNSLTSHFYKVEPNLDLERRREVLKPGSTRNLLSFGCNPHYDVISKLNFDTASWHSLYINVNVILHFSSCRFPYVCS